MTEPGIFRSAMEIYWDMADGILSVHMAISANFDLLNRRKGSYMLRSGWKMFLVIHG